MSFACVAIELTVLFSIVCLHLGISKLSESTLLLRVIDQTIVCPAIADSRVAFIQVQTAQLILRQDSQVSGFVDCRHTPVGAIITLNVQLAVYRR
jgi:hypothetical protein